MTTVTVELTYEQLRDAVRKLPSQQKTELWELLGDEIDVEAIRQRARQAVAEIREAYKHITEEEVMADVNAAVKEVRAERASRG